MATNEIVENQSDSFYQVKCNHSRLCFVFQVVLFGNSGQNWSRSLQQPSVHSPDVIPSCWASQHGSHQILCMSKQIKWSEIFHWKSKCSSLFISKFSLQISKMDFSATNFSKFWRNWEIQKFFKMFQDNLVAILQRFLRPRKKNSGEVLNSI